jgi:hypothetical protein
MDIRFPDIAEHQETFDGQAYFAAHRSLIVRAHNGYRRDRLWPARRDYVRGFPFTAVGYYQYMVADRDAAQQAREFRDAVGPLRANEFVICDCEEGQGDQRPRVQAWFEIADAWAGFRATLYSGEAFCNEHLGGWAAWRRPRWIAAYRKDEPTEPHELWQYTDVARFLGLPGPVDGNWFHGSDEQFLQTMRPGSRPTPPPIDYPEDTMALAIGTMPDGRFELFVEKSDGSVWHAWQAKQGGWAGAEKGKRNAGWYSLGTPGGAAKK